MKPVYLLLLVLALIAAPRASSAGPSDTKPTAAADARGKAHFQAGQRLSNSGDYAGAYREFEAGYTLTGRTLFLFNMAEAARANGDTSKARENYVEFLRVDPKNALAATAQARIDELDRKAGVSPGPNGGPNGTSPGPGPTGTSATPPAVTTSPGGTPHETVPLLPPPTTGSPPPNDKPGETLPAAALTTTTTTHSAESAPVWKKWPFWAVVGGVIVGGSVAVYAVTRDNGTACGAGCTQINFR